MAENSKIEWCEHTVNLWWGCAKVHTGCKNCYAEHLSDVRYKNDLWGENKSRKRIKSAFSDLEKYQKFAAFKGELHRVFIGSMMDIFEDTKPLSNPDGDIEKTGQLRYKLFEMIEKGRFLNLVFLFLTKRPENILKLIPGKWLVEPPSNVWFGTSISDNNTVEYANRLRKDMMGYNLFLSVEPQVGKIDYINLEGIGWVIQGGESGKGRRTFDLNWAIQLKEICTHFGVPYFFKQVDKIRDIETPPGYFIRQVPKFQKG